MYNGSNSNISAHRLTCKVAQNARAQNLHGKHTKIRADGTTAPLASELNLQQRRYIPKGAI